MAFWDQKTYNVRQEGSGETEQIEAENAKNAEEEARKRDPGYDGNYIIRRAR